MVGLLMQRWWGAPLPHLLCISSPTIMPPRGPPYTHDEMLSKSSWHAHFLLFCGTMRSLLLAIQKPLVGQRVWRCGQRPILPALPHPSIIPLGILRHTFRFHTIMGPVSLATHSLSVKLPLGSSKPPTKPAMIINTLHTCQINICHFGLQCRLIRLINFSFCIDLSEAGVYMYSIVR